MPEPERLKKGKAFHKYIQEEWLRDAEGRVSPEKYIVVTKGKKGRIDIFVDAGDEELVVVEIKNTDWDLMEEKNVRRNIKRQIRQIWKYIDSQFNHKNTVYPGIIFPKLPTDSTLVEKIETMFNDEGIAVVWSDETIENTKKRLG